VRPEIIHHYKEEPLPQAFRDLPDGTFFTTKNNGGLFQRTDRDHAFIWEPTDTPTAAGPDVMSPGWHGENNLIPVRVRIEVLP
jgi:hypothetical protein